MFLKKAMKAAVSAGFCFRFGTSCEFMLFHKDDNGLPIKTPHDYAGYCDVAPDDKGENIRRDVCLTLEQMGIHPISSRHESGCGQHEIDFNTSSALKAADTFLSFKTAVKSVADSHGVYASFMHKPLRNDCGNGMHISFTIFPDNDMLEESTSDGKELLKYAAAGIMGNLFAESGFDTTAMNPKSGAYGLNQWLGDSRYGAMVAYAERNHLSPSSLEAQLGYLRQELTKSGTDNYYYQGWGGTNPPGATSPVPISKVLTDPNYLNSFAGYGSAASDSVQKQMVAATTAVWALGNLRFGDEATSVGPIRDTRAPYSLAFYEKYSGR